MTCQYSKHRDQNSETENVSNTETTGSMSNTPSW